MVKRTLEVSQSKFKAPKWIFLPICLAFLVVVIPIVGVYFLLYCAFCLVDNVLRPQRYLQREANVRSLIEGNFLPDSDKLEEIVAPTPFGEPMQRRGNEIEWEFVMGEPRANDESRFNVFIKLHSERKNADKEYLDFCYFTKKCMEEDLGDGRYCISYWLQRRLSMRKPSLDKKYTSDVYVQKGNMLLGIKESSDDPYSRKTNVIIQKLRAGLSK